MTNSSLQPIKAIWNALSKVAVRQTAVEYSSVVQSWRSLYQCYFCLNVQTSGIEHRRVTLVEATQTQNTKSALSGSIVVCWSRHTVVALAPTYLQ